MRSSVFWVALNTDESGRSLPENTRNIVMWPTNGSETVLKTNAASGPAGSLPRSFSSPLFVVATTVPRSTGEGNSSAMNASSRSIPIAFAAEPQITGAIRAFAKPAFTPTAISCSESDPSSRYFSISSSSASATASMSFSREGSATAWSSSGHSPSSAIGAVRVAVGLRMQEVGDPRELRLRADRELERCHLVAERRHQLVERVLERGALAVELVHEDRTGQSRLHRELPGGLGLDLDAVDGRHDHDHGVDGPNRRTQVADEVRVAGGVEHVDLDAVPLDGSHRERDGDALALLVGIVVGDGVAVLHGTHARDRAGRVEHGFEQRGLAGAAVADQQDVADVLRVVGLQRELLPGRVRGILVKC